MRLRTGVLIALEGIDGAGKTTQADLLAKMLGEVGLEVVRTKEPTNGRWGTLLRESATTGRLSAAEELDAFLKDRREHVATLIRPALESGKVVIVDRYYYSTAAYQGSRGMNPEELVALNEEFAPRPDLLVHLDVEPSLGLERIELRGDVNNLFEQKEDLQKAAEIFRKFDGPHILRLDGRLSPDELSALISRHLYRTALFEATCLKELKVCEPAYCSYRISATCIYPELGQLDPVR